MTGSSVVYLVAMPPVPKTNKPLQFRAQVPRDIDFLIRAITPLKNSGQDWSISDVTTEALIEWLKKPENRRLVEEHNLLKALENRGLSTNIYD